MLSDKKFCTSCRTNITNVKGSAEFDCPNCAEKKLIRCFKCRELGTKYKCSKCGFEGPN